MSDARSAREALLAQLMVDMDALLNRVEVSVSSVNEAAGRLDRAAQRYNSEALRSAELARGSVGEFITKRTNEAAGQAKAELRRTLNEVVDARLQGLQNALSRMETNLATIQQVGHTGQHDRRKPLHAVVTAMLVAMSSAAIGAAIASWVITK